MPWIYLLINALALAVAGLVGWRIRRLRGRGFAICVTVAASLLGVRLFLHAHPEYEQHLLHLSDDYVYFATWEAPLAMLMVVALAGRLQSRRVRRLTLASFVFLVPLLLWNGLAACTVPEYAMPAQFDEDGVCRQQTDFSCGPASAVTLLKHVGQRVTEGEMASLCLMRPERGVTPLELCRGLNIVLRRARQQAVIERLSSSEFENLQPPFLAEIKRGSSAEHCVVVLQIEPEVVSLADPARGRCVNTKDEFLREWTGLAIVLRPVGVRPVN